MLIYGQLETEYAIVLALLVIVATFIGMHVQELIVKHSGGKHQCAVLIMVISVITICISSSSLTISTIL